MFFFFKQKTAYEMRISDWSSDVCSSDLIRAELQALLDDPGEALRPYVRMEAGTPETIWSGLDNKLDWGACFLWEYGEPNQPVLDRCPATAAALAAVPGVHIPGPAPSAFFSMDRTSVVWGQSVSLRLDLGGRR